ncbi:MAG TPA: DinB family protein [Candidatus Kapabacteria bacterium]|nr:DinB family protein [Candidatus Kapabacteria bacterium]
MTTRSEELLKELDQEMATTRRLLERVPDDKGEWRPHPKSFPLAHLAQLVARMPGWNTYALRDSKLDLSQSKGYSIETTATLLEEFDRCVAESREAIAGATDEDYDKPWSLTMGEQVLMTMPAREVVRQNINHLSHHRGQLTVYLRLLDVPIPSIYGPTADEPWGASPKQ